MVTGNEALATAMSIRMRAEIVTYRNGTIRGELHSQYFETPYIFGSLVRMIDKMEEVFDSRRFPEQFMLPRSFGVAKQGKEKKEDEGDEAMKNTTGLTKKGAVSGKCTFEISVKFRQNATWQGQIFWAEKNLKQNFRSVLEMLKLMDEAMSEGEEKSVSWE